MAIKIFGVVVDIGLVLFATFLLRLYLSIFFKKKKCLGGSIVWLLFVFWQMLGVSIEEIPGYINITVTIFLTVIISFSNYQGAVWPKMIFSLSFIAIWMLIETMCGYFFMTFGIPYVLPYHLGSIVSKLILFLVVIMLRNVFTVEDLRDLPKGFNVILLLVPIGSIFIINNTFRLSSQIKILYDDLLSCVSSIIMFVINIIIFKVYIRLAEELELRRSNTAYAQQLALYEQYLYDNESAMLAFRNERHDFKTHIISFIEYAERQDYQDIIDAAQKILSRNYDSRKQISKTQNVAVDSITNYYYSIAIKNNIEFEIDYQLPMHLPFDNADLCVIIGNALENAVEANKNIKQKKEKYIRIWIKYTENNLKLVFRNSYSGVINVDKNGNLKTIKQDDKNHGIGIRSIQKAVSKYKGTLITDYSEDEFCLKALLYNE